MESNRDQPAPARTVPRPPDQEKPAGARERDEADKQIAENLKKAPEQPVPTQEEADAIKLRHMQPAGGPGYTTR